MSMASHQLGPQSEALDNTFKGWQLWGLHTEGDYTTVPRRVLVYGGATYLLTPTLPVWGEALVHAGGYEQQSSAPFAIQVVGTGGVLSAELAYSTPAYYEWHRSVVEAFHRVRRAGLAPSLPTPQLSGPLDAPDALALIRSALSLNVSEAAQVLLVERPTIYGWASGRVSPNPRHASRIGSVLAVAKEWRRLSAQPMGKLIRLDMEGRTPLVELLKAQTIDTDTVWVRLRQIARLSGHGSLNESSRGPTLWSSVREAASEYGIEPPSELAQDQAFDATIGRRTGEE